MDTTFLILAKTQAGENVEWANQTTIHPLAILAYAIGLPFVLILGRSKALLPMLMWICLVSTAQRVVVATLDFSMIRIIVITYLMRIILRSEWKGISPVLLDFLILAWSMAATIVFTLQQGSLSAFIYRLGTSSEYLGLYFAFRCLIRNEQELISFSKQAAILSIPIAVSLLIEKLTGRNAFSVFGGVPAITPVREGKLRAQGAFAHPILAGVFWATLVPLFGNLWLHRYRVLALASVIASLFIVIACASSTPVGVLAVVLASACLWPLRKHLYGVLLFVCGCLVVLHFTMKAPVWHLIARIDVVGGSTGYHRFQLVDNAIKRFSEWALLGTRSTAHWGHSQQDVANQYVLECVRGGFLTFALFFACIVVAGIYINRWLRLSEQLSTFSTYSAYCFGMAFVAHCAAFFGVSYFGQNVVLWYGLLGIIANLNPNGWVSNDWCFFDSLDGSQGSADGDAETRDDLE